MKNDYARLRKKEERIWKLLQQRISTKRPYERLMRILVRLMHDRYVLLNT